jgi:hypothetical protein
LDSRIRHEQTKLSENDALFGQFQRSKELTGTAINTTDNDIAGAPLLRRRWLGFLRQSTSATINTMSAAYLVPNQCQEKQSKTVPRSG